MTAMTETETHLSLEPGPDLLDKEHGIPRLYHYTSVRGLLGIIESKVIWATDISFLNDSEEFRHAIRLLAKLVEQRLQGAHENDRELLQALQTALAPEHMLAAYVVSFTENGDLLSQWRGYSPEGGASLGFRVAGLMQIGKSGKFQLLKCVYDDTKKHAIANEFLDKLLEEYRSPEGPGAGDAQYSARWVVPRFYQIAACFKDSAFSEENEWRLVSSPAALDSNAIKFRATSRMIVPYYELALTEGRRLAQTEGRQTPHTLKFDRIVLGPGSQYDLMSSALLRLCLTRGVVHKDIKKSNVPYRSL